MKKLSLVKAIACSAMLMFGFQANAQSYISQAMLGSGVKNAFTKYGRDYVYYKGTKGSCGIFFGFSQVSNKYEDENVIVKLIGTNLYLWNKTDKPLYIDNRGSFSYINEKDFCFYRGIETKEGDRTIIELDARPIAPKAQRVLLRSIFNPFSGVKLEASAGGLTDMAVEFMGTVESMRSDLANAPDKTSSAVHMEQDESLLTIKAAISYSTNSNLQDPISFMVSTWVNDIILAKYYSERRNNDKKSSTSVSVRGRRKNVLHVFADSPFEYAEDESPIEYAQISFDKGMLKTSYFGISDEEYSNTMKDKKDIEDANREESTFIWEGHSSDYKTSLYDVVLKCQLQDNVKLKEAEKMAENTSKAEVKKSEFKK